METQVETTTTTTTPPAVATSELVKAAETLKKHKTAKMLAPEKRKAAPAKAKAAVKVKPAKAKVAVKAKPAKVKAKAAVKAKPARAKAKHKPVSGQSGPTIEALAFDALNKKETQVIGVFDSKGEREVRTIEELAKEAFRSQSAKKANSWVRNSLRRLIRADWLEKPEPGKYRLTEVGRKRLARVA